MQSDQSLSFPPEKCWTIVTHRAPFEDSDQTVRIHASLYPFAKHRPHPKVGEIKFSLVFFFSLL